MAQAGAIYTQIMAEDVSFQSAVKRTRSSLDGLAKKTAETNTKMAGSFGSIGKAAEGARASVAGLAAGIGIATVVGAIKQGLEYASSIGEIAQQLGVGTTALQEYRFAAADVGVTQETLEKGLQKLTRSIGDAAAGGKAQTAAFKQLGVSIRDANGEIRPTEDVLNDLITAFSGMKSPAERARLEVALFGKAGQQLDTLLAGGVDQVDNLRNAAHKLGVVISEDFIARADDTADTLAKVNTVLQANIANAVAQNSDQIIGLANSLITLASEAGKAGSAYDGFLRIVQNEGWRGFVKTWYGDGKDQIQAATPKGYAQLKIDQFKKKRDRYQAASNNGMANPVLVRGLREDMAAARQAADKASGDYLASIGGLAAKPKPRPTPAAMGVDVTPSPAASGGGGRSRSSGGGGGSSLASAAKADASALQALYDRLYPDQAKDRAFLEDLALLEGVAKKGGAAAEQAKDAMGALFAEGRAEIDKGSFVDELDLQIGDLSEEIAKLPIETVTSWEATMDANAKLARSFVDTAQDVRYSLSTLVDDIKRGDFLGILDSALRVFEAIRGTGSGAGGIFSGLGKLFGGGGSFDRSFADGAASAALAGLPKFANGGSIPVNSPGGCDRNVVTLTR